MEGIARDMSNHAAWVAQPAGRGRGREMVSLWKDIVGGLGGERFICRRSWRSAKQILPPAESPERTICDAGTGVWKDPGGG